MINGHSGNYMQSKMNTPLELVLNNVNKFLFPLILHSEQYYHSKICFAPEFSLNYYSKISYQIFIAVPAIKRAKIICKIRVFIFLPAFAPSGAASKLATIIMIAGQ